MKKRFIVLIDFSQHAETLLKIALNMAQGSDVEILAIHQSMAPVPGLGVGETQSRLKEENKEKAVKRLKDWVMGIAGEKKQVKQQVTTGHIVELVLDLWKEDTIDFLFTGIEDKDFFKRLFTGTTAIELANTTENIIFAIPENCTGLTGKPLCVALNERYALNVYALENVTSLLGGTQDLYFFSVVSSPDEKRAGHLRSVADNYNARTGAKTEIVLSSKVAEAMAEFVSKRYGLLVLQKGTRRMADAFRPFFANQVLRDAKMPVVILPATHVKE